MCLLKWSQLGLAIVFNMIRSAYAVTVPHTCNPRNAGGRDWKGCGGLRLGTPSQLTNQCMVAHACQPNYRQDVDRRLMVQTGVGKTSRSY
jgi:hypothetical protein